MTDVLADAPERLPISQRTIAASLSSAMAFKKVTPAESTAFVMIPASTRYVPLPPSPRHAIALTIHRAPRAPIKAKGVTIAELKKKPKAPPNAAPAAMPSV